MLIGLIQVILGTTIALIATFTDLRRDLDKKITSWGLYVIASSLILASLSMLNVLQENERRILDKYSILDSEIDLQLTAHTTTVYPTADLESRTPSTIEINLIFPNEGGWTFLLQSSPGFVYRGYSRGAAMHTRLYMTEAVRRSPNNHFKYVWDLANKQARILRNPRLAFSSFDDHGLVKSWSIDLTLNIKGQQFKPQDPKALSIIFVLEGLDQDSLLEEAEFSKWSIIGFRIWQNITAILT